MYLLSCCRLVYKIARHEKIVSLTALTALITLAAIGVAITLALAFRSTNTACSTGRSTTTAGPYTTSTSPTHDGYDSVYKKYRSAAVTTDTNICSQIGLLETR